jgi:hypothetical protein
VADKEMGGTCSMHEKYEKCISWSVFLKAGRPRCEWENNIKVDYKEMGYEKVVTPYRFQWWVLINKFMKP